LPQRVKFSLHGVVKESPMFESMIAVFPRERHIPHV